MFWRVTTFTQASPIESIMDREDCTLEELMDEDDIIQECKAANSRLGKRDVIERLIGYLSEPPEDEVNFKHSFTACEILCCELDDVLSQLVRDEDLLGQLFSLLDRPAPLNSTLAGYFGRVVGSLLGKRPQQMHEYLEAHRGILDKLVAHVDTTSTVEVILRLVGADDLSTSTSNEHSAWLGDTTLMTQLLDCLCAPPACSNKLERVQRAAQQNVGNILVAIAHAQCSPMFEQLNNPIYLSRMLSQAASPKDETHCDVLQPVLLVCIALLDPKTPRSAIAQTPMAFGIMRSFEAAPEPELVAARVAARAAAASEIVQFVPEFTKLLGLPEGAVQVQVQPYGTLSPPLGRQRITVVELGKALVRTQEAEAMRAMIRSDFVDRVMELFKAYPFNNILHLHVRDILGTLIQAMSAKVGGAQEVRQGEEAAGVHLADGAAVVSAEQAEVATEIQDCLFDRVSILNWLMEMSENAESTCFVPTEDRAHMPLRAAYHGHVLELAEQMNEAEKEAHRVGDNSIITAIQLSSGWASYVDHVVEPRLENEKREAWEAPMPSSDNDGLMPDDFPATMDIPDVYPNLNDDFGNTYEGDHMFGGGQVRYGMFDNEDDEDDDDDNDDDDIDVVAEEPQSHSIDGEDDDSNDSEVSNDEAAVFEPAATAQLTAQVADMQLLDMLDASTIEDDGADVVLEDGGDDVVVSAAEPLASAAVATRASCGPGSAEALTRAAQPAAARMAGAAQEVEEEAQRGASGPLLDDGGPATDGLRGGPEEVEEDAGPGAANWWKIPEKQLREEELPPPPEPEAVASGGDPAAGCT